MGPLSQAVGRFRSPPGGLAVEWLRSDDVRRQKGAEKLSIHETHSELWRPSQATARAGQLAKTRLATVLAEPSQVDPSKGLAGPRHQRFERPESASSIPGYSNHGRRWLPKPHPDRRVIRLSENVPASAPGLDMPVFLPLAVKVLWPVPIELKPSRAFAREDVRPLSRSACHRG